MSIPPTGVIDRRDALRRVALILGGALSAPAVAGFLAGCERRDAAGGDDAGFTPRALTSAHAQLVALVAEHIIPTTDTPGARAAGAPGFIDMMLADSYAPADRSHFVTGLADLDARAVNRHGRPFARCDDRDQLALLEIVDREAFAPRAAGAPTHWFRTMKELTLLAYYTSEIGATKELRYVQVPGRFEGCVPFARVGRTWAV